MTFECIAATAAIDSAGVVRAYKLEPKSVNKFKFVEFLKVLRGNIDHNVIIHCVLDNLRVHYTDLVRSFCCQNKIELVFNATYSSEFMPCEILWSISKRDFRKKIIAHTAKKLTQREITCRSSRSPAQEAQEAGRCRVVIRHEAQ